MLVDDSSKIAMLADAMPGMNNLYVLYTSIWNKLNEIDANFLKTKENEFVENAGDFLYRNGPDPA